MNHRYYLFQNLMIRFMGNFYMHILEEYFSLYPLNKEKQKKNNKIDYLDLTATRVDKQLKYAIRIL